jgi:REP element-mobilizing transposase RayT
MDTIKFQNKYRIPSARAEWHDYNGGVYFITICTAGREHYFGRIENDKMHLNTLGKVVEGNILNLKAHYPYAQIDQQVVMPNHLHLIVFVEEFRNDEHVSQQELKQQTKTTNEKMQAISHHKGLLSVAMGGLKSAITKQAHLNKIEFGWQERFHDHIIQEQKEYNRISNYIANNPVLWDADKFYS